MSPNESDGGRLDFQIIYEEFRPKIERYLNRLLGGNEAEDATQEVFLKVSHALPRFRGDSSVSTWIYRIATNVAYDKLRPASRRAGDAPLNTTVVARDESSGVEQRLVRKQVNECIDRYVSQLPVNYRSVLVLSEHEGFTNQDIAEALHLTVDTVKIRLHRARARLKKELGNGCTFFRDERNELACDPKPSVTLLRRRPRSADSTSR